MEINYGAKKVWNDLVESKENLKYFYLISIFVIVLSFADVFFKAKIFSWAGMLLLGGYFALIMNNIINGTKPVLENLSSASGDRNLFLIILKRIGIDIIYGIILLLFAIPLFILFEVLFKFSKSDLWITFTLLLILLSPLLILISFNSLLFAENLKFAEAFNIKRAIESIKKAWGKYLTLFFVYIGVAITLVVCILAIFLILGLIMYFGLKGVTASPETAKVIGDIMGSIVGGILGIAVGYWYTNAVSQIYKYSLKKNENTEN